MKLSLTSLAAMLLVASVCNAESVVGCADGGRVTFQETPCPEGATIVPTSVSVSAPTARADAQPDDDTVAATPGRKALRYRYAIHSSHDELQPGMSDLLVLNNRRWGKPQHIARSRDEHGWHEYWDYKTGANGGKQLHFVNGVLADIDDLEPVSKPIRMASATMAE